MDTITRLQEIRETEMRSHNIKSQDAWMELYGKRTGQYMNKTTMWYWEKPEDDKDFRPADMRYLRFLCSEFNYHPGYILGLTDEPFLNVRKVEDFPNLKHIVETISSSKVLTLGFRKILAENYPNLLLEVHLDMFCQHPELYEKFKDLVKTFEENPEFFGNGVSKD